MNRLRAALFFVLLSVLLAGCGYTRAGRTSPLVQGRPLYLAIFANRTYQPNIDAEFRRKLLDELALRGETLSVESRADLVLSGELESPPLATTAFSAFDKAKIYRLTLTARLQLAERQSGKVIWKAVETQSQEYPATADLGLQRNSRDAAIAALCSRMAQTIAQKMDQAF